MKIAKNEKLIFHSFQLDAGLFPIKDMNSENRNQKNHKIDFSFGSKKFGKKICSKVNFFFGGGLRPHQKASRVWEFFKDWWTIVGTG